MEELCSKGYKILDKVAGGRHPIEKDLCEGTQADSGNMCPMEQVREKSGKNIGRNNYGFEES